MRRTMQRIALERRWPAALGALAALAALVGCGGGGDVIPLGALGGSCYPEGDCDEGLTCTAALVCEDLGDCEPTVIGECVCHSGDVGGRICLIGGDWSPCTCLPTCGDGECLQGESYQSCPQDCIGGVCGDSVVDDDEVCDDGNASNADGCLTACTMPSNCCVPNVCGDGYVDERDDGAGGQVEACDDGNTEDGDTCSADCSQVLSP